MIELEHTLIMLLLLINLLPANPGLHSSLKWFAAGLIFLAFLAPSIPLALPWGFFSAVFIPILLWQSAQRLGNAQWVGSRHDLLIWLVLAVGISGVVFWTGGLPVTSSLLFGLLAASIVWNAVSDTKKDTLLGQIGVLTLVFLLTETEAVIEAPGQLLLALFVSGLLGAAVGYFSVQAAVHVKTSMLRNLLSIAQVYLAYGIGLLAGMSGGVAAVLSIVVFVGYGAKRGLWPEGQIQPKPFDNNIIYIIGVAALAFFGWQTHVPFTPVVILEVALALILTSIVFWIDRRVNRPKVAIQNNLYQTLFQVGFLLAAALLLWPKSLLVDPIPLLSAFVIAGLTVLSVYILLTPMLNLFSWLQETRSGSLSVMPASTLLAKELLQEKFLTLSPETPVEDLPGLLSEHSTGCAMIVNESGKLAGIITEADLFVMEEKLPRTDVSYLAVFKNPIQSDSITQAYRRARGQLRASDIMSHPVITVKDDEPVAEAVWRMVHFGYQCLPVIHEDVGGEERLIGLITRSSLIQYFFASVKDAYRNPSIQKGE